MRHRICERCPNSFISANDTDAVCPRCQVKEWEDVCERIYSMFPTVTKVEVNPGSLLGFMVGIQNRLETAEGKVMSEAREKELSDTKKECIRQARRATVAERKVARMRQSFGAIGSLVRSAESLCRDVPAGKLSLLLEGPLDGIERIAAEMGTQPWLWPLEGDDVRSLPEDDSVFDGTFGFERKYETHSGVDLYCNEGQIARAVDDGRVILVPDFTGENAGSPWWHPTKAVVVDHGDGKFVVYGELEPWATIRPGVSVRRGQPLGRVLRVRKEARGKPTTMLHLELWASEATVMATYEGERATVACDWPRGGERPSGLLDPTPWLALAKEEWV